jgi:hypothetical protein
MPMNFLLWQALETSATSHHEEGRGASIKREEGEVVLVFHADTADFRRRFGVENVCDALFFYKKPPARPILLFVELKGHDIEHAAKQIRMTMMAVREGLRGQLGNLGPANAEHRAVIVTSGVAAPRELARLRRDFERETQVALKVETVKKGACDLRKYLR